MAAIVLLCIPWYQFDRFVSSAIADPSLPFNLQPKDIHFMDGSGDSNIRVNMADIAASFNYESREDSYSDDPFQAMEEEELHGGSFDPNDSFSWYNQRNPFEDVADVIMSDDEDGADDNIAEGSTCEEDSQDAESSTEEEAAANDPDPPVAPHLTNSTVNFCFQLKYD